MFLDLPTVAPQIKAGKVRALAVSTAQRVPSYPDLPTVAESGVPGFDAAAWQGFSVPAGTPPAVIARLNAAYLKVASDPALIQKMLDLGTQLVPGTPETMAAYIRSETDKWSKTIREAGISLD